MKRKLITIVILILFLCGVCRICYAVETGTVYLESSRDILEKGEELEITVNLRDNDTAAFNFSIYFDNTKLDYISKIDNTNVEDNHIIYVWHDATGGRSPNQGEIAKFKFKAKEHGLVTFSIDGQFYNASGQLIKTNFEEEQVQIGKENEKLQNQSDNEQGTNSQISNANLQVLRLDVEGITPSFNKDIYEYYLTVSNDVKDIDILAIAENPNTTIDIIGNTNLKEGLNIVKIQVTSEDKKVNRVYSIYVTKTDNLVAANTNLEILAIENALLNPPFDASQTQYKTEVSKDTENLNIFAVPENESAKVKIEGGKDLKEGTNLVNVTVTAANGFSNKKYQIEVYKRNEEEQTKYEENQKQQSQKVEEAYEIEKTSSSEEQEEKTENNAIWYITILCIGLILGEIAFWYFKFKKKK